MIQASSRCEQQSSVSDSSSRRSSSDSMSAIVSSAARNAAAQREPWKISPTSCMPISPRSRSVRGSTPAICWTRVGAAATRMGGGRRPRRGRAARPARRRARPRRRRWRRRTGPARPTSSADRTSSRSTSTRAPSTASNNAAHLGADEPVAAVALDPWACASSTCSTLFAAAGRGTAAAGWRRTRGRTRGRAAAPASGSSCRPAGRLVERVVGDAGEQQEHLA